MIVLDSLKQIFRHLIRDLAFNTLASSVMVPTRVRWVVLRMMGCKVERSRICPRCFISSRRLRVHRGVFVNYNCFFDASDWVTLAENVSIGMGCTFVTSSHEIASANRRAGTPKKAPITIERGVWIGANVTLLAGVTVGAGSVIAGGAVVISDLPPDGVYAGVPARLIRSLETA